MHCRPLVEIGDKALFGPQRLFGGRWRAFLLEKQSTPVSSWANLARQVNYFSLHRPLLVPGQHSFHRPPLVAAQVYFY